MHLADVTWPVHMRVIRPHLLGKEEGCVFETSTKLELPPLCLWGLLDLVTPMYAPQQITTPYLIFSFQPRFSSLRSEACQLGL